ncbi:MAG: ABC transporter substrate-binding protein, partial [Methylophilaceae bacterium]
FNALLESSGRDLGIFSAIVLDQPFSRQMALIKLVLPEAKSLGILLGPDSARYAENLSEEAEKSALRGEFESIKEEAELIPKLQNTLASNDAILAIPDALIYNRETAQPILLTSYRHQKPVFGYSQSYVRAGALAAIFSSTKQFARQAAEIAIKTQQAPGLLPPPQIPRYFSVLVNHQVARSLNIAVPDNEELYNQLLKLEAVRQ